MKRQEIILDDRWSEVLSILPRDLEESARECGAVERLRKVPSAANLLRMMLAYALSDLSLKDTAAWARAEGIAHLSGQAFHYRLINADKWIEHLLGQLLLERGTEGLTDLPLRIVDGSVVTGPGSQGTDWVAHMVIDPVAGQITSVEITDARGAETFIRHRVNPGEVVLGDRMYATARGIESVVNRGGYPVVRVNPRTLKICDLSKKRIHLKSFEALVAKKGIISLDVLIPTPPDMTGKKSKAWDLKEATSWIPARIVGGRTRKGVIWVLTTLSREQLSDKGVLKLYRLRWQVELLFKRLKSLLHLDHLPTRDGPISKSWLLARLLAAAIAQSLVKPMNVFSPCRGHERSGADLKSERLVKISRRFVGAQSSNPRKWRLASHNQ